MQKPNSKMTVTESPPPSHAHSLTACDLQYMLVLSATSLTGCSGLLTFSGPLLSKPSCAGLQEWSLLHSQPSPHHPPLFSIHHPLFMTYEPSQDSSFPKAKRPALSLELCCVKAVVYGSVSFDQPHMPQERSRLDSWTLQSLCRSSIQWELCWGASGRW